MNGKQKHVLKGHAFYSRLDWSLPDSELSKRTGKHRSLIFKWRARLGKPKVKGRLIARGAYRLADAKGWQWQKGATALAAQHGISRWWVYRIAQRLGRKPGMAR